MTKKNNPFPIIILSLFCVIETVLGYFVQTTSGKTCSIVSLSVVVLALVLAIVFYKRTTLHLLTLAALVNTVFADFFLCGLVDFENVRVVAMTFF